MTELNNPVMSLRSFIQEKRTRACGHSASPAGQHSSCGTVGVSESFRSSNSRTGYGGLGLSIGPYLENVRGREPTIETRAGFAFGDGLTGYTAGVEHLKQGGSLIG